MSDPERRIYSGEYEQYTDTSMRSRYYSASYRFSRKGILNSIQQDTVLPLPENEPIIFYSYGHHGYRWCLLTKRGKDVIAFSGKVDNEERNITDDTKANQFDTVKLFSANEDLLSWAFESLAAEAKKLKPKKKKIFFSGFDQLLVLDSEGKCVFKSDDASKFSGRHSADFNKKVSRLAVLMLWISAPDIRKYFPASAIYPDSVS